MIYYVYLDADVIPAAETDNQLSSLLTALRGFLTNCLLFDFGDYRNDTLIKDYTNSISDPDKRKRIKTCFGQLRKKNRFAHYIESNDSSSEEINHVFGQSKKLQIDILIVPQIDSNWSIPDGLTVCTLDTYAESDFEELRYKRATEGIILNRGELTENEFADNILVKILRYSKRIEFYDHTYRHFRSDHQRSTKFLLKLLEEKNKSADKLEIYFHTVKPEGDKDRDIKEFINDCKKNRLSESNIFLQWHGRHFNRQIPHGRYFLTDQFSIFIDPGLDFIIKVNGCCNELTWNFKSKDDVRKQIAQYDQFKHGDPVLV